MQLDSMGGMGLFYWGIDWFYYLLPEQGQRIYIFIFLRSIMEAYELTVDIIILCLAAPPNKSLCQSVIKYLSAEDIRMISRELQKKQMQNPLTQLIRTYYFLSSYLNKVDRTFYYSFYEEQNFLQVEATHTALLAHNYSNCFLQFPNQYRKCLHFITRLFPDYLQPLELIAEIQRMITDTDIPMPKLKRENQGIFCRTSFQNYLIYLRFKNQCFADYDEIFESLNLYFQDKDEIYLQKFFMKAAKDKALNKIIRFVRFTPYQITYSNYEQYLVCNNSLHNFLVIMFALTDVWLTSIKCYIASLEDPFHRYIQLITRYSIYRNYVISVEENLSFVFEQYNQLYCEVFGGGKPMYRFWRPAMTKWMVKFEEYHAECSSVYYYCLTKVRTKSALQFLGEKEQQQPDVYMSIKNKMAQREHEIDVNETLLPNKRSNGVQEFFQKDHDLYQTILIEYVEYMVDLSINEETVHWCGHSEQILSEPYLSFEKYVLAENKMYVNYIRDIVSECPSREMVQKVFYQQELQFLQTVQFKPITLKKLVEHFNLELSDSPVLSEGFEGVSYNFRSNDQTLRYFNQKANIKYELSEQQMYFYSITPLVTADELLTKSISTTCADELEEEEESECDMEYFSHNSSVEDYDNDAKRDVEFSDKKRDLSEETSCTVADITIKRNLSTYQTTASLLKKASQQKKHSLVPIQKQQQAGEHKISELNSLQSKISSSSSSSQPPLDLKYKQSQVGIEGSHDNKQINKYTSIDQQLDCL